MNVISVFEPVAERLAPHNPTGTVFTLRRSGSRPLSFSGRLLGQRSGLRPGAAVWHDFSLFQTNEGRFVAEIRVATRTHPQGEQFHVGMTDTLDETLIFFEQYDPRADVPAGFNIEDPALSPVELLAHAAALRFRIIDTVTQYRVVLGMFLTELNTV